MEKEDMPEKKVETQGVSEAGFNKKICCYVCLFFTVSVLFAAGGFCAYFFTRKDVIQTIKLLSFSTSGNGSTLEEMFSNLPLTPELEDKLRLGDRGNTTDLLARLLREHLAKEGVNLDINKEEIKFTKDLPNQCVDTTECGCRLEVRDVKTWATIKQSSSFSVQNTLFSSDPGVFLEVQLDAVIGADGSLRGRGKVTDLKDWIKNIRRRRSTSPLEVMKIRKKRGFFDKIKNEVDRVVDKVEKEADRVVDKVEKEADRVGDKLDCAQLVRKTIDFNMESTGTVKIGVRLNVTNFSFKTTGRGFELSFDPLFVVVGEVVDWNLSQLEASDCKLKLFNAKLLSYCGDLEKRAREEIEQYMGKVQGVELPQIVKKVETKLNNKAGKTVKIPIDII